MGKLVTVLNNGAEPAGVGSIPSLGFVPLKIGAGANAEAMYRMIRSEIEEKLQARPPSLARSGGNAEKVAPLACRGRTAA